jgi:hypothetical protein
MQPRETSFKIFARNEIQPNFNVEKGMALYDWVSGFLSRHQELTIKKLKQCHT